MDIVLMLYYNQSVQLGLFLQTIITVGSILQSVSAVGQFNKQPAVDITVTS